MAVDEVSRAATFPNFVTILSSKKSLEETLARFDEQLALHTPDVIRKRLRKRLCNVKMNIDSNDLKL